MAMDYEPAVMTLIPAIAGVVFYILIMRYGRETAKPTIPTHCCPHCGSTRVGSFCSNCGARQGDTEDRNEQR